MSRTLSGKFASKSTPKYMEEAKALKANGMTCKEIARTLAARYPALKGISPATASYWSRGLTAAPSIRHVLEEKRSAKRSKRIDEVLTLHVLKPKIFNEQLKAILDQKVTLNPSHKRRLVRLLREIFHPDTKPETHRDQLFNTQVFNIISDPKLRPKLVKLINDKIEDGYVQGQLKKDKEAAKTPASIVAKILATTPVKTKDTKPPKTVDHKPAKTPVKTSAKPTAKPRGQLVQTIHWDVHNQEVIPPTNITTPLTNKRDWNVDTKPKAKARNWDVDTKNSKSLASSKPAPQAKPRTRKLPAKA